MFSVRKVHDRKTETIKNRWIAAEKMKTVEEGNYLIAASNLLFTSSQFTMFQKASTNLALSFL